MLTDKKDMFWLNKAFYYANKAKLIEEIPVGALIIKDDEFICGSGNKKEKSVSCVRHAEIEVIELASKIINNWRLLNCTLYITLEPCIMCLGALMHARISRVVYGAINPKFGAYTLGYKCNEDKRLNHSFNMCYIHNQNCENIMRNFFRQKRNKII